MWFAIIFWAVVLIMWFLGSQRCSYVNQGYRISQRYDFVLKEPTSCLKLIEMTELAICNDVFELEYRTKDFFKDLSQQEITTSSQRATLHICKWIAKFSQKHPKLQYTGLNFCVIAKYIICYPLITAFSISTFIAVFSYIYVRNYISYLSTYEHILFYVIPIFLFGIPMAILHRQRDEWHWPTAHKCFLFAFWISFGLSFFLYNWHDAKMKYETEMAETFGEEWEDEIEELEAEEAF